MVAIDRKAIQIRPYTKDDHDQVISILIGGFSSLDYPIFLQKAKHYTTVFSILLKSVIYTALIELGLAAYNNSSSATTSSTRSFAGLSLEDLRSFSETLMKPESVESLLGQFMQPSFLLVGAIVTLTVTVVTLVNTYRWSLATNAEYVSNCFKDDLSDITGYYQSKTSTNNKRNRSQYWVACLASHPQLIMGCIALDDNWAHMEHLKTKHLAQGGTEETFRVPKEADAELRRLSVHSDYRRLGIGKMLMETLMAHAKKNGFKRVVFSTTYLQTAALVGYIRFGFEKERTARYGNFITLWFGTMNLYATEKEKEEQKSKQEAMLLEIGAA